MSEVKKYQELVKLLPKISEAVPDAELYAMISPETNAAEWNALMTTTDTPRVFEPVIGAGFLGFVANGPMNFLMQQTAYFNVSLGDGFAILAILSFSVCNMFGLMLMIWKGGSVSFDVRIVSSGIAICALTLGVPILSYFEFGFRLYVALVLIAILGLAVAVFTSATMGLTGLCSAKMRAGYTLGMSFPGLTAAPVVAGLTWMFTMTGLSLERNEESASPVDTASTMGLMILSSVITVVSVFYYMYSFRHEETIKNALKEDKPKLLQNEQVTFWKACSDALPMATCIFLLMIITFVVIPDQVSRWTSKHTYPGGEFMYQSLNFYCFQVFDTIGRLVVFFGNVLFPPAVVIAGCSLRAVFIPLYFIVEKITWFNHDAVKFLITASFAFSYGMFLPMAFQHAPKKTATSGYFMSFAISIGILVGCCIALAIQQIPPMLSRNSVFNEECNINMTTYTLACTEPLLATTTGIPS